MSKLFGNSRSAAHAAGSHMSRPAEKKESPGEIWDDAAWDALFDNSPEEPQEQEPPLREEEPQEQELLYYEDEPVKNPPREKKKQPHAFLRGIATVLLLLMLAYAFVVWVPFGPVRKLRNMYIETALSTMNHRWLATSFFPKSVVEEVRQGMIDAQAAQEGLISDWNSNETAQTEEVTVVVDIPDIPVDPSADLNTENDPAEEAFFQLFWELDREQTLKWLEKNPGLLKDGWAHLYANEAGLNDDGLPIETTMGEQVLAIDAYNQVLLVRVKGTGYRGVLAIAKDPARLSLQVSQNIGSMGQYAGTIAQKHNGLLAITGSGFWDEDGHGKGGAVTGWARCDGADYGQHIYQYGYKRFELREDNLLYITDTSAKVNPSTTDAMEFSPALIVDGDIVVDRNCGWTAVNPRACLGQSSRYEILMLAIEGRQTASLGTDVIECAKILKAHDCAQAMNMDGGTSAMLWYDGEPVIRCSNQALPEGRLLPDAWVYAKRGN